MFRICHSMPLRPSLLLAPLPFLAAACLAAYNSKIAVRDQFVTDVTCPKDRVTVSPTAANLPPPDVAADPARLALWHSQALPEYLARGCGQEIRFSVTQLRDGDLLVAPDPPLTSLTPLVQPRLATP